MIVKLHESNCRMMKSRKKSMKKKVLKNKTLAKPSEVIKIHEWYNIKS